MDYAILGLAAGSISYTIARAGIFRPLRDWLERRRFYKALELAECPYCLAHWVTLAALPFMPGPALDAHPVIAWAASLFFPVAVATGFHAVALKAYTPLIEEARRRMNARYARPMKPSE